MRSILFISSLLIYIPSISQAIKIGPGDTTSMLPRGVIIEKGKLKIKTGYEGRFSANNKIITVYAIQSGSGPGIITGSFSCSACNEGDCSIVKERETLSCKGADCCRLIISTGITENSLLLTSKNDNRGLGKWKKISIAAPDKNTTHQNITSDLPDGIQLKKGKLTVKEGYAIKYSNTKKYAIVYQLKKPESASGSFTCNCSGLQGIFGSCGFETIDEAIFCKSESCSRCRISVRINPTTSEINAIQLENTDALPQKEWKEYIFPDRMTN